MVCPKCRNEIPDESSYCLKCGSSLNVIVELSSGTSEAEAVVMAAPSGSTGGAGRTHPVPSTASDQGLEEVVPGQIGSDDRVNSVACGRCNRRVLDGPGCSVYSEAIQGIAVDQRLFFSTSATKGTEKGDTGVRCLGAMLYCDDCVSALFTKKVWEDAKDLRIEMDLGCNGPRCSPPKFSR